MEPFTTPGCDNVTVEDDVTVISSAPKPYVSVSAYTAPTEQQPDLTKLSYSWSDLVAAMTVHKGYTPVRFSLQNLIGDVV